jgi:uncharacterized membrane protein
MSPPLDKARHPLGPAHTGDRIMVTAQIQHRRGSHRGPLHVQVYFMSPQTRLPMGTVACTVTFYFSTDMAPNGDRRMYSHILFQRRHGSQWGPSHVQSHFISAQIWLPMGTVACTVTFYFSADTAPNGDRRIQSHFISAQTRLPMGTVACTVAFHFSTDTAPIGD